jgi:hypothetical protein
MLNRSNIQWSVKTLYNMTKKENINYHNYVQRNPVWDNSRKSLFIHSLLTGYPVPPFYAARNDGQYDMLDGLQRGDTTVGFLDDTFMLVLDENYREIVLENGEIFNLEGKKFSELPEELQDKIKDFSFTVYYFDGITDDEIEEMFFRLNNGKPLTAIELTRVKAKSFDVIKGLAAHELLTTALSEKAILKYNNEAIVMNTYMTIYTDEPSYTTKHVREVIQSADITAEQAQQITAVFDKILAVHKSLSNSEPKVAKRMLKKTHLLSLTKLASVVSENDLRDFVREFFPNTGRAATISDKYNGACQYGSAKPESVAKRLSEIQRAYDKMKGNEQVILEATEKKEVIPEIKKHVKTDSEVLKEAERHFESLSTEGMMGTVEKEFEDFGGLDDLSSELEDEAVVQ